MKSRYDKGQLGRLLARMGIVVSLYADARGQIAQPAALQADPLEQGQQVDRATAPVHAASVDELTDRLIDELAATLAAAGYPVTIQRPLTPECATRIANAISRALQESECDVVEHATEPTSPTPDCEVGG